MQQVYSQNNEQTIILNYFGDKIGTFLDLGANDGVTLSNTRALYEKGWRGCLVEPSPKAFARLQANYAGADKFRIDLLNYAVGPTDGRVKMFESGPLLGSDDISLVSTVNVGELKRWNKIQFNEVEVDMIPLDVLIDHLATFVRYEFVSIDIEGCELDVLKQVPLRDLGCELLCVEWNGKNRAGFDAVVMHQGYKLLHTNAENLLYCVK